MLKQCRFILPILFAVMVFAMPALSQSTDPDAPTPLSNGEITGSSRGNLSDDKTYYFSLSVVPGTLSLIADLNPVKGTGGGVLRWHYLDAKFKQIKWDQMTAQGNPERKTNDTKVLAKRKILIKVVVSGSVDYKMKFSGAGL